MNLTNSHPQTETPIAAPYSQAFEDNKPSHGLLDAPGVRARLGRAVSSLTGDVHLRQDLIQEAELHWWQQELRCPHQKESWYRESCIMHLRNYLRHGRSIDSHKRRHFACPIIEESDELEPDGHNLDAQESFLEGLLFRDELAQFSMLLKPVDRTILVKRIEGLEVREIAGELHVSDRAIKSHLAEIRAMAVRRKIILLLPSNVGAKKN